MSDITIDDLVIKYEVPFWSQVKDSIMIDIEKYPRFGVTTIDSEIYNTDYYAPQTNKVPWCDAFKKVVIDHQQFLAETLSDPKQGVTVSPMEVTPMAMWFQQYASDGGSHGWHTHPTSWYSTVLYVDLPETADTTEIYLNGKVHKVDAKEGEIVSFPSYLHHRSAPFVSEKMKTIVAWNSYPYVGM